MLVGTFGTLFVYGIRIFRVHGVRKQSLNFSPTTKHLLPSDSHISQPPNNIMIALAGDDDDCMIVSVSV